MNAYEKLTSEACEDGIEIIEKEFNSDRIKGLYCDRTIAINKNIKTAAERLTCWQKNSGTTTPLSGISLICQIPGTASRKGRRDCGPITSGSGSPGSSVRLSMAVGTDMRWQSILT